MIVSKAEFSREIGVSKSCITSYLKDGKIDGDAIVGSGRFARIDSSIACAQLRDRLSPTERAGLNGLADLGDDAPEASLTDQIRVEKLRIAKVHADLAEAEAMAAHGKWMLAADVRGEMNRIVSQIIVSFESAIPDMASAVAAKQVTAQREVLHIMRTEFLAWRKREVERRGAKTA